MARILSIDFGSKRTGLAVTDPLQIIVSGLDTVMTIDLEQFLDKYFTNEEIESVVLGYPFVDGIYNKSLDKKIKGLKRRIEQRFDVPVILHDESFTSERAKKVILQSGAKKSKRRDKTLVDKMSAVLILQDYLGHY